MRLTPALFGILLSLAPALKAQENRAQPAALEFLGFRAGASLGEVSGALKLVRGGVLRCQLARADKRLSECHADFVDPSTGRPLELWLSAMDSLAGVLMVSGPISGDQLLLWRKSLEAAYGEVGAQVHGPQWMMQWVRQGRMLRLTWRLDEGRKLASVSLVDGHVLDAWGQRRASTRPARR
jgi:hypothetical protein